MYIHIFTPFNSVYRSWEATGQIEASELMVSLHTIEARDEKQIKAVIQAIYLCFKETDIFTHDVLAGVLQQLLDMTPIPTLFMRTVIIITIITTTTTRHNILSSVEHQGTIELVLLIRNSY